MSRTPDKRRGVNRSRSRSGSQERSRSFDSGEKRDKRSLSPRADLDKETGSDEKANGIQ